MLLNKLLKQKRQSNIFFIGCTYFLLLLISFFLSIMVFAFLTPFLLVLFFLRSFPCFSLLSILLENENFDTKDFSIFISRKKWISSILRPSLSQQKQPSKQLATPTSRLSAMQVSSSVINDSHEIHHDGSMSGPLGRGTLGGNEGGNDYQTRESSTSRLSVLQRVSGIFANFGASFAAGPGRGRNSSVSANGGISENDDSIMLSIAHSVPFEIRLKMMKDAVAGIQFMHSKGFMHCDIKSLNFLVDEVSSFLLCFFV
jgi:serine/threonine protein kinase